jgi:hypothetical protein
MEDASPSVFLPSHAQSKACCHSIVTPILFPAASHPAHTLPRLCPLASATAAPAAFIVAAARTQSCRHV